MLGLLLSPILLLTIPFLFLLRQRAHTIYGTLSRTSTSKPLTLPYSPTELTNTDLITIFLHVLLKYVPFLGAPSLTPTATGFSLPPVRLAGPLRLTERSLALFKTAVPGASTNPMLLVALTTPLYIVTLTHPMSPIKPIGAVNTRNMITYQDASFCGNAAKILEASRAGKLTFAAALEREGQRKKRGVESSVTISVSRGGEVVMVQELRFLQFLSRATKPLFKDDRAKQPLQSKLEVSGTASLSEVVISADGPRKYAASCKDYNPIHVSAWAAKACGFPSAIAHGNFTVAMLMQRVLEAGGEAARWFGEDEKKGGDVVLDMAFLKPVTPLPASLRVSSVSGSSSGGKRRMEIVASLKEQTCVFSSVERR